MNKKGNTFIGIVLGLLIFVFGVLIVPYIADDITDTRVTLNCANPSDITGGTMLTCLQMSIIIPYFIWLFVSIFLGLIIGGKI